MIKLIRYLQANKRLNIFVLLMYFLIVVLPHERVGIVIAKLFENQSRENYNLIVLVIASVIFTGISFFIIRQLINREKKKLLIFYFIVTLIFVLICFNVLFVMNIESIHFIQYALFAILCYPLLKDYFQTLIFATIAGAFDEGYQYFYLAPNRTDYYDWNDVIINLIGAAIGLLILRTFLSDQIKSSIWFFKSWVFYFLCIIVILVIGFLSFGVLTIYPEESGDALYSLVKVLPEGFWSYPPGPYVKYHVVMPLEGILIITFLWLFFSKINVNDK